MITRKPAICYEITAKPVIIYLRKLSYFFISIKSYRISFPAINEFLEEYDEWMVFSHTIESQGLTALGRMSVEQFNNMIEHQIKSTEGEQHRPNYKDKNND